jgi:hypothetical protein
MFKDNCFERFVPECLVKGKTMVFCAGTGRVKQPLQMPVFSTYPIIYDVFQSKIQMKQSSGFTKIM